MKQYITIPKEYIKLTDNQILVWAYLQSRRNFNNDISECSQKEISAHTQIKLRTVVTIINHLVSSKLISKQTTYKDGKKYNSYLIKQPEKDFYFLDASTFFNECRNGFILRLKCACYDYTLQPVTKDKLCSLLDVSLPTLNKRLKDVAKWCKYYDDGLMLDNSLFPLMDKDYKTDFYNCLYKWCFANNCFCMPYEYSRNKTFERLATLWKEEHNFLERLKPTKYITLSYLESMLNEQNSFTV